MKKILILLVCWVMMFAAGSIDSMAQLDGRGNAPDFILTDVDGNEHHLYEYLDSGKVVVLDFFAVWCGICQSNTTVLESIYEKYGPEGIEKIELLSLEADNSTTDQQVLDYVETFSSTNPHINATMETGSDYKIPGFPIYYIVAPDRSYRYFPGVEMNLEDALSEAIETSPGLRYIDNDARIIGFSEPRGTYCQTDIIPFMEIQNYGKNEISDLVLQINMDGEVVQTQHLTQVLQPYEYLEVTMPPLENVEHGWHAINFEITSVNSSDDAELNNGPSSGFFLFLKESEEIEIQFNSDTYPAETFWQIMEDGKVASERLSYDKARTQFSDIVCLEDNHCYSLVIYDRFGDGLSEGGIEVLYKGISLASLSSDSINGSSSEMCFCVNSGTSGIDANNLYRFQIEVYPNPTSGRITIAIPEITADPVSLSLHNMAGQVILKESGIGLSSKKTIDLSAFPNGIFFLRIAFANQIITKKILIHK